MGELYNQFTGAVDSRPLSEKEPGRLELAVTAPDRPDQQKAVRLLNAAKKTGLPQDVIEANLDEIEAKMSANDFDAEKFRTESPIVAGWLAQSPAHAASLVAAERDNWSYLEKLTNSVRESYENERDMKERSGLLLRELNGETLSPIETARREKLGGDMMHRASKYGDAESNSEYLARVNTSGITQMAGSTIESLKGGSTAAITLGVLGAVVSRGNPEITKQGFAFGMTAGSMVSGAAYSYRQEAPLIFDDIRNMKDVNGVRVDIGTARNVAKLAGTINATIETASTAAVMSLVPGVKNVVSRAMGVDVAKKAVMDQIKLALTKPTTSAALKAAAAGFVAAPSVEALEEFMQSMVAAGGREVAQASSDQIFAPDDFGKDLAEAGSQAKDAFFGSMAAMGIPTGGSRLYSGMRDAKVAAQNQNYYVELGRAISESKLAKESPDTVRDLAEQVVGPNAPDVFIDATQWRTYFQNKNLDPQEVARQVWGSTEEYDNALKGDTTMRLSMADYAVKLAPTEHNAFFSKEIRQESSDMMNGREAEEMQKDADKLVKEESEKSKSLRDEISSRLQKIGYEQSTADTSAIGMAAFFETTSKKLGIADPLALFERYGVDIARGTEADLAALDIPAYKQDYKDFMKAVTDPTEVTKADKVAQELGNFAMGLREKIADRVERTKALTEEYVKKGAFIFQSEDVVQSNTTGKLYKITGRYVDEPIVGKGKEPSERQLAAAGPKYRYESVLPKDTEGWSAGSFIAGKAHEGFTLINRPTSDGKYMQTETPMQKLNRLADAVKNKISPKPVVADATEGASFFDAARKARGETTIEGGGEGADFLTAANKAKGLYRQVKRKNPFPESAVKGYISIGPDKKISIKMMENSDLSTFIHESGHLYLEVLRDIASPSGWESLKTMMGSELKDGDQRAEMLDDLGKISKWLGAKGETEPVVYHSGTFTPGSKISGVVYASANEELAKTYAVDGGSAQAMVMMAKNPAPADVVMREAKALGMDNGQYTPASIFDADLHGEAEVNSLVDKLESLGYDHAVMHDIAMGKQIEGEVQILFPSTQTRAAAVANLDDITVEQHEQFARAIEMYFMEGKAPSVELRGAFARIRAWMTALYKTVSALNVRINPEIRDVFDRMFATQEAIESAKKEAEIVPVFATKEDAGMSEVEFAAYGKLLADASSRAQDELQQKVMKQMQREQKAEWKRRWVEIRDQIAEQVSKQPEYVLMDFLAEDGNKLSRDDLYAAYPEKYAENLTLQALHNLDVYRSKEGLPPQAVAEQHGYTSVDHMVKSLIEARPYKEYVDEQTDVRMKELYGDIMTDGTIEEEARKYVMGPGRSEVLVMELKALRKRQRESKPMVSAVVREGRATRTAGMESLQTAIPRLSVVRGIAVDTIARMRIRNISPQTYLIGSRNASKEAIKAVHKGDYGIAAYHKQKELLNLELYREAQKAKADVESISKFMRTFEESAVRERLGRAGDFYLEQIDAILERFDFSRMTTKDANKRKSLVQWVEDQKAKGAQINLTDEMLNEAYRKPWKEMTYDELVGVSDAAKHIKHLATLKNKLLKSKAGRELNATITLIDETMAINARHAESRQRETRLPQEALATATAGFFAAHRKISSLAREMDGFVDGGPVWESIIWPINEAAAAEAMMHEVSNNKLRELFKPYVTVSEKAKVLATTLSAGTFASGIYKKEFISEINDSLSKAGRLMVALNWGNEGNRQRIMDGYQWTTQQVEAILAPLTKEDWDFVQGVLDHFESYWPQVESLAKRVDGIAPKKVQAATILTPFGEYRGGYFPLSYDDRQSPKAYANLAKEAADRAMHGAAIRASTAHGERINRVANVKMPVRLDFGVITEALSETIHDITHYETLIDLNRVIGNPRVQSSMVAHFGYEVYQQFRSALRDIAGGDIPAQTQVDKSLNWLRKGTTIASMGWNVSTALMQPLGITQSIVRAGVVPFAKGVGRWLGDAAHMENSVKWVYEKSKIMQERSITQSREINEIRNQVSSGGLLAPVQDSYFYMIVKMQQVVDIPTWLGAYEGAMEQFNGDETKAVAVADQVVLDSQGGGQIKDMSAVQRGGPAQKLWTNFYSYFNTTFNLTAESYRKNNLTNPYEAGRFAVDMLLLYTIPAVLSMLIRDALKGALEDDEDKLLKKMALQQLAYMTGPVLLARELGGAIQGFYGYEGPAGAQFFSSASKLTKQIGQGEADSALWKALNKTAGVLFHYPAGQLQRLVEGMMYDADHGSINPIPLVAGPPKD